VTGVTLILVPSYEEVAEDLKLTMNRPHSSVALVRGLPWPRGTNENTNGLLRQYFRKGSDLSEHGPDYLRDVEERLNNRPRRTHGWSTPGVVLARFMTP